MSAIASLAIQTLFAPFDDTTAAFLAFVKSAKSSIHINIYGYHLPALTDALLSAHARGLTVSIILDHSQAAGRAEASEVQRLLDAGVPLLVGTSPVHGAILHSKFCVVDEVSVEFGSWNYSISASQQSNDMHFIVDQPQYARAYLQHHDRILSFIELHEMTMQPAKEVRPVAALQEDQAA